MLSSIGPVLLLAFGFGFVIFWHELGHFLAAKWADVKVEQFAVGFGQALLSWRKGLGFRWGSTNAEYLQKLEQYLEDRHLEPRSTSVTRPANEPELSGISTFGDLPTGSETAPSDGHTAAQLSRASTALGISETEYRLNWIPLGGYVKMLGQDDMKPGVSVNDPRSYNNKTIAQRMVIVSAGVVMNVILAAIGFMAIFTIGYEVPKPVIGAVVPGSPAQQTFKMVGDKIEPAPLQVGDRILELNGRTQSDFDKIKLNTALLIAGEKVPLVVERADGSIDALTIIPAKADPDSEFPAIGVAEGLTLKGPPKDEKIESSGQQLSELLLLKDGDVITQVNGAPVQSDQYPALYNALQTAAGKPVDVTIRNADGTARTASLQPHFMDRFGGAPVNFAGLEMLTQIDSVEAASPAKDLLQPGDVITGVTGLTAGSTPHGFPTRKELIEQISGAGAAGAQLKMDLLRGGKPITVQVDPKLKIAPGRYGLGIGLDMDEHDLIVADTLDNSPAKLAGVPRGAVVQSINGTPVQNWFDVNNAIAALTPATPLVLTTQVNGKPVTFNLGMLSQDEIDFVRQNRLETYSAALLQPATYVRVAPHVWVAAQWGIGETRDAILQVYQTVRAMVKGSISSKQLSGPVGILAAGYMFAERGITRLIWFLSIISANLAVMNFLPIPIVDGGLFTFLIIEKIKGGPVSPRVHAIAQVVGLAILLSVFLFATYQDVFYRLPFLNR